MTVRYQFWVIAVLAALLTECSKNSVPRSLLSPPEVSASDTLSYPGVPQSTIYSVSITQGDNTKKLVVFQNTCPVYQTGYMNMSAKDEYPLALFAGRSISWANFSFSGSVTVKVTV